MNSTDIETAVGENLLAEATIAAHFVAVAEAAGLTAGQINTHLQAIAAKTGLEFWITDETGWPTCAAPSRGPLPV